VREVLERDLDAGALELAAEAQETRRGHRVPERVAVRRCGEEDPHAPTPHMKERGVKVSGRCRLAEEAMDRYPFAPVRVRQSPVTTMQNRSNRAPRVHLLPLLLLVSAAAACTSGGDEESDAFLIRATPWSVGPNTKVSITGGVIAWIADEATTGPGGTDLNGDGDVADACAVYANATTQQRLDVGIAVLDLTWCGGELFLAVNETADGRDWNLDTDMTDNVLVHWSAITLTATFVDEISTASVQRMVASGSRLLYPTADAVAGINQSSLRTVDAAMPTTAVDVTTTDVVGALHPSILKIEEGLVFLSVSEIAEARDLNGDADMTDATVLALLDLTTAGAQVRNVGLALPGTSAPLRAKAITTADWQVGFLVDEADQGNTNLNDPALFAPTWVAGQCVGLGDVDMNDDVLHYLRFAAWVADPVASPVRNTGLVGVDKIAISSSFIATITPENAANGTLGEGTCDLNGDGDKTDRVVRWTEMVTGILPILPPNGVANIHALDDTPGGTHGLAELQDRFVIVVDENADNLDIDGDAAMTHDLVGWLLPSTTPTAWTFLHSAAFAGASWLSETRFRTRLNLAFQESVAGFSLNDQGDNDLNDSIPTFPVFASASVLSFPGIRIAVDPAQPGIAITGPLAFYRVSEAADNRDWTNDGQLNDRVIFRSSFSQGTTAGNGISCAVNRPAIEFDQESGSPLAAAFITDESMQTVSGFDINGDGDATDLVLQYFLMQ
jgi:hypothetical protein